MECSYESSPSPPPFPRTHIYEPNTKRSKDCCCCSRHNDHLLDRLFAEGYLADVHVYTNNGIIPAHSNILGMASPVMKQMLRKPKQRGSRWRSISIRGVPDHAVLIFLRFLYSSRFEEEEMNEYALHLMVLSHVFAVPTLKKICAGKLERSLLTTENVIDVLQLAELCDAPRLYLLCHRLIMDNFKAVSETEGWRIMRESNPDLEKALLEAVIEIDAKRKERRKKMEERKIYVQLHEAMEALVHICREGCRKIGPKDRKLRRNSMGPCRFPACRGLGSLVRHFAVCEKRFVGGCRHCKRMWQLLELHSRLCDQSQTCKVPLCSHFKDRVQLHSKKDEEIWKLLVRRVLEAKRFSRLPYSIEVSVSALAV